MSVYVETRDVPLPELARFPGNARRGDVEAIRASIRRHGQYRALVVRDTGDGLVILAGNHTHDAIAAEGHVTARCEILKCDDDEARRINLADNRLAELGTYDTDALAELLAGLDDYDGTGYTDAEVAALLDPLTSTDDAPAAQDKPADPPVMSGAMPAIVHGNARAIPMPDNSVDLIITSPPYFALRSYQDDGQHYDGQIGDEPTPREFVDSLITCTREMMRVLKPTGSIFVNLGDKYSSGNSGDAGPNVSQACRTSRQRAKPTTGMQPKSLLGVPWRYALRCVDELGLILRAEIIWSKPNGLPESVTDRVRRSHEQWFHFTLQPHYFSAVDEIREATHRVGLTWDERKTTGARTHAPDNGHMSGGPGMAAHALGKLPGSVWTVATQPLTVPAELGIDHFAAFPMEWPRRIVRGWSPRAVCSTCGEGRRPVAETTRNQAPMSAERARERVAATGGLISGGTEKSTLGGTTSHAITGYACACPDASAPSTPAVVLDPFGGTGTTALVATMAGRIGISLDASADYCRLAEWRTRDPKQRARAAGDEPETDDDVEQEDGGDHDPDAG